MSKTKLALDVVQDLRSLADSLEALASAAMGETPAQTEKPTQTAEKPVNTKPTNTKPATQTAEPSATPEKSLTLVELRAFVAERSTPENRPKIKALLTKHGVNKLTELPEDQYETLKREVEAL
jgi:hypothetical protein